VHCQKFNTQATADNKLHLWGIKHAGIQRDAK